MRRDMMIEMPLRMQHLDCTMRVYTHNPAQGIVSTKISELIAIAKTDVAQTLKSLAVTNESIRHDQDNEIVALSNETFPALENFSWSAYYQDQAVSLFPVIMRSRNLKRLDLTLNEQLTVDCVQDMKLLFARIERLQILNLRLVRGITDELVEVIVTSFPNLKELSLAMDVRQLGGQQNNAEKKLTDESLFHLSRMTGLRNLSLNFPKWKISQDAVINFLRGFSRESLTSFSLSAELNSSPGFTPEQELKMMRKKNVLQRAVINDEDVF